MNDIDFRVRTLFSNAVNGGDYTLRDNSDGAGPFIDRWDRVEPKPTVAELTSVTAGQIQAVRDADVDIRAALLLSRAIDETFLDGHWITLRALAANGIATGVAKLDAAVSADDREKFDQFFRDRVAARI